MAPSEVMLAAAGSVEETVSFGVYAEVRSEELGLEAWPAEPRLALLRMQFDARRRGYLTQFPGAMEYAIVRAGEPVGWVTVEETATALRCVDVAIRPGARGRGLGTAVLRRLQQMSAAIDRPLVVSVLRTNARARSLYDRLGFRETGGTDTHAHLEWRA